jgi:hypothetical protein
MRSLIKLAYESLQAIAFMNTMNWRSKPVSVQITKKKNFIQKSWFKWQTRGKKHWKSQFYIGRIYLCHRYAEICMNNVRQERLSIKIRNRSGPIHIRALERDERHEKCKPAENYWVSGILVPWWLFPKVKFNFFSIYL